jgi:hypothetical protein
MSHLVPLCKFNLYREVLTQPVEAEDSKFNTFSITDKAYTTYINIGIWKDLESFDAAVGTYIQAPEKRKPLAGSYKGQRDACDLST